MSWENNFKNTAVFWDVALCILWAMALVMEAVSTSETSVNFYETTRRNIPKDSHLHIRRCENLKSNFENICHRVIQTKSALA
jgi:hypothetical protein